MSNGSGSFQDRLHAFMRGRNWADELAVSIVVLAVILGVIDMFARWHSCQKKFRSSGFACFICIRKALLKNC